MSAISRRDLLKGLAMAGGATLLAACQPKVVEVTRVVKEEVAVEKEVTRVVKEVVEKAAETKVFRVHWRLGNVRPHYPERIKDLEAMYPGLKVNSEEFPAGSAEFGPKIGAMVAAGAAGDLVWSAIGSGSWQFFVAMGAAIPVEPFIEADSSGFTLEPYWPRLVESLRYSPETGMGRGVLYSIPELAHGTQQCLFFNKTLLENLGLPFPPADDSWTRDDLLEVAIKATDSANRRFGFLPATGDFSNTRHAALAFGGDLMSEDGRTSLIESSEGLHKATRWMYDCFHTNNCAPTAQERSGGVNQMFLANRLAMYQSGTWGVSIENVVKDTFEWDMVIMPKGPVARGGNLHIDGFLILKDAKYKEEAYEFSKLLTNLESGVAYAVHNGLAARPDVYDDKRVQERWHFWKVYKQSIEESVAHIGPANMRKQESQVLIRTTFDPLWIGDEEPTDAWFAQASQTFQDYLDKPFE